MSLALLRALVRLYSKIKSDFQDAISKIASTNMELNIWKSDRYGWMRSKSRSVYTTPCFDRYL